MTGFWEKIVANHIICPYNIKLQLNKMIGDELVNFLYFGLFLNPLKTRPPNISTIVSVKLRGGLALSQGVSFEGFFSSCTCTVLGHLVCQESKDRFLC